MGDISNDFSWSKSRHEKFRECQRGYYLHYYASWGGWEKTAPADVRELYVLKKLGNRWTWGGSIVHDAIRDALLEVRSGKEPKLEETIARAHSLMRMDFRSSRAHVYRERKPRPNFHGLIEHEYAETLDAEVWKKNWSSVEQALRFFFGSRWIPFARSLQPRQWLEVDDGFETSNFQHHGVKVFAVPDFAYLDEDGAPVVVDWKTGQARHGYDAQVLGYAVYLATRYRLPVERVRTKLVFLNEGTEEDVAVTPEALAQFEAQFQASVAAMRALLLAPEGNVPMPMHLFAQTEDLAVCRRCVFRRPCRREASSAAPRLDATPAEVPAAPLQAPSAQLG